MESGRNLIADGAAETVRNSFPGIGIIAGTGQVKLLTNGIRKNKNRVVRVKQVLSQWIMINRRL